MNQIHTHPGQPEMQVEVILASKTTTGAPPIYTIRMRYPRIIHGEVLTHRVFSRNARSSRAVPVATMLEEIRTRPFVPWHWGKNQRGMQADEECNNLVQMYQDEWSDTDEMSREEAWLFLSRNAACAAEAFMTAGYHKQIPNRLLEPFSWMDCLITSTDWRNFLWLRDHKDAEPHLQDLARLVKQAIEEAEPKTLSPQSWHLPYITDEDLAYAAEHYWDDWEKVISFLCKISAARCARISYKPFNGDASYEAELARYDLLVKSDRVHASPLEHQAMPDSLIEFSTEFEDGSDEVGTRWNNPHLHGNFSGWIQFRKTIPGEHHG
jgi:hypothetical protein